MSGELIEFLPGVPAELCLATLRAAPGNELASGKFLSPQSSSALAVNCFGWFLERPELLPPFPGVGASWPAASIRLEAEMRFPWLGGKHPWLDAAIETEDALIGVESKRFEPFRDKKVAKFAETYDRPVWGGAMAPYRAMLDLLRKEPSRYRYLDAAQLIKHALGLATQSRRKGKQGLLFYLFAEPQMLEGRSIGSIHHVAHRAEIADFNEAVKGSEVEFRSASYFEWLETWPAACGDHALALRRRFLSGS